jgi:CheY-like chemotaxis protein
MTIEKTDMKLDGSAYDNIIDIHNPTRILIVDDNKDIHDDFRLILDSSQTKKNDELDSLLEQILKKQPTPNNEDYHFQIDSAFQGQEALKLIEESYQSEAPYSVVFVDIRMPPGWNGIETIRQIWKKHPQLEMVICTAYSDFSWEEINQVLGGSDHLLVLKKPFDRMEVKQLALSLSAKANYYKQSQECIAALENTVKKQIKELKATKEQAESTNRIK